MSANSTNDIVPARKALLGAAIAAVVLVAAPGPANAWETGPLGPSEVRFNVQQDVTANQARVYDRSFDKLQAHTQR